LEVYKVGEFVNRRERKREKTGTPRRDVYSLRTRL